MDMSTRTTNDMTARAVEWSENLWKAAEQRWEHRSGQDLNYRRLVVHPALNDLFDSHYGAGRHPRVIEPGCGDGSFLDDPRLKGRIAAGGTYLGMDREPELLGIAAEKHHEPFCRFVRAAMEDDFTEKARAGGRSFDCAVSVFAVQELPDFEGLAQSLSSLLEPEACIMIITVHPEFGDWLRNTGTMNVAKNLTPGPTDEAPAKWRWAGEYPIVDEPREPFPLPYFHRTIHDYASALAACGIKVVEIKELPDPDRDLPGLVKEGTPPFSAYPTNVYWPRIGEAPSSVAIVARKEPAG